MDILLIAFTIQLTIPESVWTYKIYIFTRNRATIKFVFGWLWCQIKSIHQRGLRVMVCVSTQRDRDNGERITRSSFEFGQRGKAPKLEFNVVCLLWLCSGAHFFFVKCCEKEQKRVLRQQWKTENPSNGFENLSSMTIMSH